MRNDSIDKIKDYLLALSNDVTLSALFFRDYACPALCGGCCLKFTLDYFEGERWESFKNLYPEKVSRFISRKVNDVNIYTDFQKDNKTKFCINLDVNGRCTIHEANPFTCEFELMKIISRKGKSSILINKLYGRGWNFQRIDGNKGALCEMKSFSYNKLLNDIRLLKELNHISKLFKIKTKLNDILNYLQNNLNRFEVGLLPKCNINFKKPDNEILF